MAAAERPRLLVTGGAGYIGSHVCRAAAAAGYLPVAFDDMSSGHDWAVRWGPLERGDIGDGRRLGEVVRRWRPAATVHLAGLIVSSESATDPSPYYRCNVAGTLTLIDSLRAHAQGAPVAVVFSSSAAVYGNAGTMPIGEDHPHGPVSPYGASKAMAERLFADSAAAYGLRAACLRYFNAAGACAADGIGEAHPVETHLIPLAIAALDQAGGPLTIYGEDYATRDGTCIRDYVHVADLADAHLLAVRYLLEKSGNFVFNLGSGQGASVRQVLAVLAELQGHPVPTRVACRRLGDPAILLADIAKARRDLGWRPVRSDLRDIVESAMAWHRSLRMRGIGLAAQ